MYEHICTYMFLSGFGVRTVWNISWPHRLNIAGLLHTIIYYKHHVQLHDYESLALNRISVLFGLSTSGDHCGVMFTPTRLISTLLCLLLVQHPVAAKNRFNISLEQLDACESLDIPLSSGYAYKDFFVVHKFDNNKVQTNERIHLKFYVLTTMDAHILLSVTNYPRHNDRVYEIGKSVVG